ncbi:hypothetical protein [Azospirillum doebereinerae]
MGSLGNVRDPAFAGMTVHEVTIQSLWHKAVVSGMRA